jgi:hypothetical protein
MTALKGLKLITKFRTKEKQVIDGLQDQPIN